MKESIISRRLSEFIGVTLFAAALFWIVSLVSYDPNDPAWFFNVGTTGDTANFAGQVGAFLAELSFQLLGYAAFGIPVAFIVVGWPYFWCHDVDAPGTKTFGASLLAACICTFLSMAVTASAVHGIASHSGGGALGQWLASQMQDYLHRTGSIIVLMALSFISVIISTQFSFGRAFSALVGAVSNGATDAVSRLHDWREERQREQQRQDVIAKHTKKAGADPIAVAAVAAIAETGAGAARTSRRRPAQDAGEQAAAGVAPVPPPAPARAIVPPARPRVAAPPTPPPLAESESGTKAPAERRIGDYMLPPMALLDAPKAERKIDERELMTSARLLEEKCREFSVEGTVTQIHPGPVVTTYEFKPEAGVKYSKITGLADDLCLAMQAESVLIDRIPGKSTVGIQIPNSIRSSISLRELLESSAYESTTAKLPIALGKTIHGDPYVADLAAMPHLLIAGSTGTGKSVGINSMLTSILYRATPDDVRLIMVDPKRLELGMYEDIPHLLTPVVVDPKQAANALRWAVREMEERYKTLAGEGVRNLEQYNRNIRQAIAEKRTPPAGGEYPKPLPMIIVLIDELADLMMVAGNEVEQSICRLAQMARAVGIHLILATQRPSVDVITGLIKANMPSRISFRVASKIDSRTILDGNGAEQLLGKGDMLFMPPASSRAVRLHGPYISEQESARLASFLRKQGKPTYDETITAEEKSMAEGGIDMEKDDLYDEAARIVVSSGQASISYLQRRLRIGFSRAARLIDMMEMEGIVSPSAGGKAREVLVDKGYFEEVDAQLR